MASSTERAIRLPDASGAEHEYRIVLHPAGEGWKLLAKLGRVAGRAFGSGLDALFGGGVEGALDRKVDGVALGAAISELAGKMVEEGEVDLVQSVLRYATRDSEKLADCFDKAYQGNYGELLAALAWVLSENFGTVATAPFGRIQSGSRG